MNWNWACEQMLKGKKVKLKNWQFGYWYMSKSSHFVYDNIGCKCLMDMDMMRNTDWELYQEPKKWTEEDIREAKAGIALGFEWIAKDRNTDVYMFEETPYKDKDNPIWVTPFAGRRCEIFRHQFNPIKWEDEEPTRLQDIVNSEVKE